MRLSLLISAKNSQNTGHGGFALPTILIASIVMLSVLLVSATSVTALRTAINGQYYAQLAQVAGDAGVAYATACLQASGNVPTWSNANPLTPHTDCNGAAQGAYPTYVMQNGNIRSGFSVGLPTLDGSGKAIAIPNTGYVELTRASNGDVWRRFDQPTAQAAVVPDLCSGSATTTLGWAPVAIRTTAYSFPVGSADQVSNTSGLSYPGPIFFRRDFSITKEGYYTLYNQGDDLSELYLDGKLISTAPWPTVDSQTISLSAGCHSIQVKLTNTSILQNAAGLKVAVMPDSGTKPVLVTDSSWRVAVGDLKHFSDVNYYQSGGASGYWGWGAARDMGAATAMSASWASVSGDSGARWIDTNHSYDASNNYPAGQYTLFRDSRDVSLAANTDVKVTMFCDYTCYPYIDGNLVNAGISYPSGPVSFTVTLTAGSHEFAFLAYNDTGPSGFALAAVDSNGLVLTSTDSTWQAASGWSATNPGSSYSYDNSFNPSPDSRQVKVLVVAGGGGGGGSTGGGGGAGGVISTVQSLATGSYPVVIGGGGAGGANKSIGVSGNNSSFNGLTAIGGGGGGYSAGTGISAAGLDGGSGGGGESYITPTVSGMGVLGQGYPGGPFGLVGGSGGGSGGGGAGGTGPSRQIASQGGNGGVGLTSNISGTNKYYAGGGGGGFGGTGGLGGGGGGADVGGAGAANTGGGGGAGWSYASGAGGAGGSGIVIISYLTGSISAIGGTMTTSGGYTIHTFTSNGTFTVYDPYVAGTNIAPPFSQWTLINGATYNSSTGILTPNATSGRATSPLVFVNRPGSINISGDMYATTVSPNASLAPKGGYHMGIAYYGSDGVTPAQNTSGYTANGCAQAVTLSVWNLGTVSCGWLGGPNVYYIQYYIYGYYAAGYASSDLMIKNPTLKLY